MPSDRYNVSRRNWLKAAGAGAMAGVAGCLGSTGSSGGQDYPSQDIQAIIGFSPGGSYDVYTRQYSETFPLDVELVPQNRPGAGSRTGLAEVQSADPDGYTIGTFLSPGVGIYQALVGTERVDVYELEFICDVSQHAYAIAVAADGPYNTFEDLISAAEEDQVVFSATSPTSPTVMNVALAGNELGILDGIKFLSGMPGAQETRVSVVSGDVDAVMTTIPAAVPFMEDGDLELVVQFNDESDDLLADIAPDTPLSKEWGLDKFNNIFALNYPYVAPPGTDEEIIGVLESAFKEATNTEAMQQWSAEADRPLSFLNRDDAKSIVTEGVDTFSEFKDVLVPVIEELEG